MEHSTQKQILSMVGYHNTLPFLMGLRESGTFELILDIPSRCLDYFIEGKVDISLVPVGSLVDIADNEYDIITDYCIGSDGAVRTVCLFSDTPLQDIHTIYLDHHSRTSAELVKILMREHWKQEIEYRSMHHATSDLEEGEGIMLIGDKVFEAEGRYAYKEDLGQVWKEFSGLPFVFAVWIARKGVESSVVDKLNADLTDGVGMIEESADWDVDIAGVDFKEYFEKYIDYRFDNDKQKAMKLFQELLYLETK